MKACKACFNGPGPTEVVTAKALQGKCDFCASNQKIHLVWDTSVWEDQFASLFDNYEIDSHGESIDKIVQRDWNIFDLASGQIFGFLNSVFKSGHEFLEPSVRVRHKVVPGSPGYLQVWNSYIDHVKRVNRFFPPRNLSLGALEPLGDLILSNSRDVGEGTSFFRGRLIDGDTPFPVDEMGMPPAYKATGGRANPAGIPHLYLAFSKDACAAECRVGLNGYISIAEFTTRRSFKTLDLNDVDSINPFTTEGDLGAILESQTVLNRLRDEISIPARSFDSALDYIATQFLCEYAKSLGLSGVIYPSTLLAGGINLVLFDESLVECSPEVESFEIVRDDFRLRPVNNED